MTTELLLFVFSGMMREAFFDGIGLIAGLTRRTNRAKNMVKKGSTNISLFAMSSFWLWILMGGSSRRTDCVGLMDSGKNCLVLIRRSHAAFTNTQRHWYDNAQSCENAEANRLTPPLDGRGGTVARESVLGPTILLHVVHIFLVDNVCLLISDS